MIQGRLLTGGCSFTEYCWSTWADILGQQFTQYKNYGIAASDNANIARIIINESQENDTVVILWTSFDRWSMYESNKIFPTRHNQKNHWSHRGSLMSNNEFFTKHYHPVERFQTTMDYVRLIDLHSKVIGYTAHHFPAFPWLKGEAESDVNQTIQSIFDRTAIANNYLTEMSLKDMQIQNKQEFILKHRYNNKDNHPTPITHLEYAQKIIAPKLGIDLNNVDFSSIMLEQEAVLNGIVK